MPGLTAVNAVIMFTINGVFNNPQQLKQFGVDDVADVDTLTVAMTEMGVDGVLSGGYVFEKVSYTYTLKANSPSCFMFDQWKLANDAAEDTFTANGLLKLKSLGTKWNWRKGFLVKWQPAPNVKKLLQDRKFVVEWERVTPQPS